MKPNKSPELTEIGGAGDKVTCSCQSCNRPGLGGTDPATVLDMRPYFGGEGPEQGVCIDPCIAEDIKALWRAGIRTGGSCCSHNGQLGAYPSVGILDPADVPRAVEVLEGRSGRRWLVECHSHSFVDAEVSNHHIGATTQGGKMSEEERALMTTEEMLEEARKCDKAGSDSRDGLVWYAAGEAWTMVANLCHRLEDLTPNPADKIVSDGWKTETGRKFRRVLR